MNMSYSNLCFKEVCNKGTALYLSCASTKALHLFMNFLKKDTYHASTNITSIHELSQEGYLPCKYKHYICSWTVSRRILTMQVQTLHLFMNFLKKDTYHASTNITSIHELSQEGYLPCKYKHYIYSWTFSRRILTMQVQTLHLFMNCLKKDTYHASTNITSIHELSQEGYLPCKYKHYICSWNL